MSNDLTSFYEFVQSAGQLRTEMHAKRWTRAVLQTLGLNISGAAKKALRGALPSELGDHVGRVFWLFNFRDENMTAEYFQDRVGRRAGNTDKLFAKVPTQAVFGAVRSMVSSDAASKVADSLSPELRELWDSAPVPSKA